jgi:conjugative transposon TraM protein
METQKKANKKKLLIALPFLVLPFITFGAWSLGLVGKEDTSHQEATEKGLNLKLPDAHNSSGIMDKMSYYDQATADSMKKRQQGQNDPYYHGSAESGQERRGDSIRGMMQPQPYSYSPGNGQYRDANEAKVYEKIGQLNKALQQPPQTQSYSGYSQSYNSQPPQSSMNTADVERLEKMMQTMQGHDTGDDPETKQLNSMLERILDIQHPERVKEKIKASEDLRKGRVYAVVPAEKKGRISLIDNSAVKASKEESGSSNGFYGLSDSTSDIPEQNAIDAVVHEDQTLVNGSIIKLRLLDDINVRGIVVPKDNFIYGTVSLEGERLTVKIKSLRYKKSLYPVQLSVFDIDGMDGIYIPGAIARDVAKSSADRSIQTFGMNSFDQTLGAQAAGAGIEAAKSFLSKKIKLIKVMVKAGYKVLLRDDKQKDE